MKMQFKNTAIILMLMTSLSFSSIVHAEEITLPVVSKPAVLSEGTQRELSAQQIAELLPWAKESKSLLIDLLQSIESLTNIDKHERMVETITNVVSESAGKNSELLMRYVLNRGVAVDQVLLKEMDQDAVGSIDARNRVLIASIKMAINYYNQDMEMIAKKTKTAYASFGITYFDFLNELNKSIFDASAQYYIQKTALEWLQWDLYRDLNNTTYASQILKINNSLKLLGTKKLTDAQAIANIRHMKQVVVDLNVDGKSIRKEVAATEPGTVLQKNEFVTKVNFSYDSDNFRECVKLKEEDNSSSVASVYCREVIKSSGFDFLSESFRACYKVYDTTLSSSASVDSCVSEIQTYKFNFKTNNFAKCHSLKSADKTSAVAAQECRVEIVKSGFNFLTKSFDSCHMQAYKHLDSSPSTDLCVRLISSRKVDFAGSNFLKCHALMSPNISSSTAIDTCSLVIDLKKFNFEDKNFLSCYEVKFRSLNSADAVKNCLKEMM